MHYAYGEYDGQDFPTPDSLFSYSQIMDFILAYGEKALDAMQKMDPADAEILEQLMKDGMLDKVAGRYRLTPRAINAMQNRALMEIFSHLPRGTRDGHPTTNPGAAADRLEGTKKYQFGDPISELDLNQTLRNALARRQPDPPSPAPSATANGQSAIPYPLINIREHDLELHQLEGSTNIALCILIDMSGSMMRYGRFLAAKKVAMALSALVRQRFPQDTVDLVGFYSTATRIREEQLPLLMPKQVSTHEYMINVKCPLADASKTHQHFTNLQLGMQMGRKILGARQAEQKLMFVITDGQPTAHVDGDTLFLQYPPTRTTAMATLREALLCMRAGIRIASFALIEDYYGMEWVEFIDQLTRLAKGVAFYCASGDLASCVMESYLSGKKKKTYIA
ncbi:MAG TPA: VWA domain-containing protein [Phycisphaerae bacterium]|nr:VWA domain-containing protein [Phycisphaerae bacterium]